MDHNQSNEQKFRDWVRKELDETQRAQLSMFQMIKNLEGKVNAIGQNKIASRKALAKFAIPKKD